MVFELTEVPVILQIFHAFPDGIITDFEETKKAIISASDLPMSIIIVGKYYSKYILLTVLFKM